MYKRLLDKLSGECKDLKSAIVEQKKLPVLLIKFLFYMVAVLAAFYGCRHWSVSSSKTLLVLGVLVLLALWDLFQMLKAIKNRNRQYEIHHISIREIALVLCNSIILVWEMETLCNELFAEMTWKNFGLDVVITFIICVCVVAACNSLTVGMIISNLFFLLWSVASYYVLQFRETPLQYADLGGAGTALDVASSYDFSLNRQIVLICILTFCCVVYYAQHWDYRFAKKKVGRIVVHIAGLLLCIGCYQTLIHSDLMSNLNVALYYFRPLDTYQTYGTETAFFAYAEVLDVDKPESYSASYIKEITENAVAQYHKDSDDTESEQITPTNIIAIMNESLADYTVYPNVEIDQDYLSFYHSLTKNTIKGNCYVSVYGSGTDCTEYEFLTGNSMEFKPHIHAYCGLFNQNCFSLVSAMKQQGYTTVAAHAAKATNWNRGTIYKYFGFDQFLTLEDFETLKNDDSYEGPYKTRNYISDQCDYRRIEQVLEEKEEGEPLFVFNVTIENHGGYNKENYESTVHLLNYEGSDKAEVEQYLTLAKNSDDALKDLISYFEKVEEPTMIVMFGDHHPGLSDEFWDYVQGTDYDENLLTKQQMRYQTPYMIWTNYDMPSVDNYDISINYLGSYVMELAGLSLTPYNQFLLNQREEIPIMNFLGYIDENGTSHSYSEEGQDLEWLNQYNSLIYNGLKVDKGDGELYQVGD